MEKTKVIRVSSKGYEKFLEIQRKRPQDNSNAATFDHILVVYEESWRRDKP